MDDGAIARAGTRKHFMRRVNRDIVPLFDASLLDQMVLVSTQQPFKDSPTPKVRIPEWIFLIINVLTELLSVAFDQLSYMNKPRYAFIAMLMSVGAAIICIIELAYKAGKKSKLPWFYHPSPRHRRFGTFLEMIGLVCAMLQTISSAVAYTFTFNMLIIPSKYLPGQLSLP